MSDRRRYLAVLAPLALAGCAYTPDEVEERRQHGYAMAQGAHDQIIHDTNVNYAYEMPQAREWNMPSIFGLPASGAMVLFVGALLVILAIGITAVVLRYRARLAAAEEERRIAQTREQQLTERRRLDQDTAKALTKAHDCPTCGATAAQQMASQRALDAVRDDPTP
jgi:hypothetical protein